DDAIEAPVERLPGGDPADHALVGGGLERGGALRLVARARRRVVAVEAQREPPRRWVGVAASRARAGGAGQKPAVLAASRLATLAERRAATGRGVARTSAEEAFAASGVGVTRRVRRLHTHHEVAARRLAGDASWRE